LLTFPLWILLWGVDRSLSPHQESYDSHRYSTDTFFRQMAFTSPPPLSEHIPFGEPHQKSDSSYDPPLFFPLFYDGPVDDYVSPNARDGCVVAISQCLPCCSLVSLYPSSCSLPLPIELDFTTVFFRGTKLSGKSKPAVICAHIETDESCRNGGFPSPLRWCNPMQNS